MVHQSGEDEERPLTRRAARSSGPDPEPQFLEHLRSAREEVEAHVSNAIDQFDQVNERIKQRTGRDLIVAILIGLALGAVLFLSLVVVKWLFVPFALAVALLGVFELSRALRDGGRKVDITMQLIVGAAIVLVGYFGPAWLFWVTVVVCIAVLAVWRMIAQMIAQDGRTYADVLSDVLIAAFVPSYVPFLAALSVVLLKQEGGQWWVLSFLVIAIAVDTGAYAAGVSFGRHPMVPKISPKKTWEGFGGAVIAAIGAGVLLGLFLLELQWWAGVILGIAVLLTATVGDLAESMIKRDLGIKDMSSWVPGHGGVLDRLDSILPSAAVGLCLYFLLSPWATVL